MYFIFLSDNLCSSYLFENNAHQRLAKSTRHQPVALWNMQPVKRIHLNKY